MRRAFAVLASLAMIGVLAASGPPASGSAKPHVDPLGKAGTNAAPLAHWCNTDGVTCTEPYQNWEDFPWFDKAESHVNIGEYIGHDEPSLLFYSGQAGSGNDNTYHITIPKDPPVLPQQDGGGGTFNFQLRPAFWLGMAMCDDESAPNPDWSGSKFPDSTHCPADSDSNIFVGTNPNNAQTYMGAHPGTAFMEMQFYPPGWVPWPVGNSCDATRWCAALNIDSLSEDFNTGDVNNDTCLNSAGIEPVNFAYLTKTGAATTSADPLNGDRFNLDPARDFFMNSGDKIQVHMYDTGAGFTVVVNDNTTHRTGSMVASKANGFASVNFNPQGTECTLTRHGFHPAYSTSSERTTVPWAAHSYNVAYSDEIGHFEYCNKVRLDSLLSCAQPGGFDTSNGGDPQDDNYCLPVPGIPSTDTTRIHVTGCLGILGDSDIDFDGVSYDDHAWPGSSSNATVNHLLAPTPLMFTSPTFGGKDYSRVAFEADLPRIEDFRPDDPFGGVNQTCQRFITNPSDPNPGQGCVLPPPQSRFYPFYSTRMVGGQCMWQEGGRYLQARNRFGGVKQYGTLFVNKYAGVDANGHMVVSTRYNNFHQTLSENPCRS
jgi:hypothetical protein